MRWRLLAEAFVVVAIGLWQFFKSLEQANVSLAELIGEEDIEVGMQWPYVVAATIFLVQFLVFFIVVVVLRVMLEFKDPGSEEIRFLSRLREIATMIATIAFGSGAYYGFMASRGSGLLRICAASILYGQVEQRTTLHYFLWAFLAPLQWVMFVRLYTQGSMPDAISAALPTAGCMLAGLASVSVNESDEGWVPPVWQARINFLIACFCLVMTFKRVYDLPLERHTAASGRYYLKVKVLVWCTYPAVHLARTFGLLTAWQEQVLGYTTLDLVAKSLSLIASCSVPLVDMFLNSLRSLSVAGAAQDVRITVDSSWVVQSSESSAQPSEQLLELLGTDTGGMNFLQQVVAKPFDQQRLLQVVDNVDMQSTFMAQKLPITVTLASGKSTEAEIFVSRSLWGFRQLAITLTQIYERDCEDPVNLPGSSAMVDPGQGSTSLPTGTNGGNSANSSSSSSNTHGLNRSSIGLGAPATNPMSRAIDDLVCLLAKGFQAMSVGELNRRASYGQRTRNGLRLQSLGEARAPLSVGTALSDMPRLVPLRH